ncbi:hypothetical protein [Rhizobium ruizarguesonis]|uniref:hypothetical protein n=1 Tax=Rhizobium ruizarguesonis TaxID=2081791 RepID=UPI0029620771|nr:hypothetical protein [Rhizobium ruizarguesonis]
MPAPSKKLKLRPVLVENPFHSRAHPADETNPRDVVAMMNVRESAVTTMAARGVLDAAQVAAADRFRRLWESMGGKEQALSITARNTLTVARAAI